jgi:hypothetical protein
MWLVRVHDKAPQSPSRHKRGQHLDHFTPKIRVSETRRLLAFADLIRNGAPHWIKVTTLCRNAYYARTAACHILPPTAACAHCVPT